MTNFKPFDPNQVMQDFNSAQPIMNGPPQAGMPVGQVANYTPPSPLYAAPPAPSSPPPQQAQGGYQQRSYPQNRSYNGGQKKLTSHFTGRIMRKQDKNGQMVEEVECAITKLGQEFLQNNPVGTYKLAFRISPNLDKVRSSGQGYCQGYRDGEDKGEVVLLGYFRLNSKGWEAKRQREGTQGQYPQQNVAYNAPRY